MTEPLVQPSAITDLTMSYQAEILICTQCHSTLTRSTQGLICPTCNLTFGCTHGFINMIGDPALRTLLVEHSYDEEHGLDQKRRVTTWNKWVKVLKQHKATSGSVLEIGAGSGLLSWGLLQDSDFNDIHISDISPVFLKMIASEHDEYSKTAHYYLCDANRLPFRTSCMDCIVGNSVLHHFVDYENTLLSVHNILKPGGKAIFFEPVLNGKSIIAMLTQLLWQVDSRAENRVFTDDQHKQLRHISGHITSQANQRNHNTDIARLEKMEDKYIFDIRVMKRMAHKIGFSHLYVENNTPLDKSYWLYVSHQLELAGFERQKLENYRYLFDTVRDTLSATMFKYMTTPMVFLVFEK